MSFTWDHAAGQRSGLTSGRTTSAYTYDPAGRLQSLTHNLAGTSADQVIGLGYNPASQIASRTGTNDAFAWPGSVAVDRPYSVNGQNQYLTAGPATFTYDANGNLTSDGSSTFVYDVENRLVSASGAKTAALVYDPLGRLFETSGGAAGITRFLYDDDALIAEYNSAGTMLHRYIHGPDKGVDDPLIWYDNLAGGWRRALIADQQGSIIAVADMYGNALAINAYDEYGIPKTNNAGRFQYTGQAWIPELGMYYYKARIYSPTLGRFLQTDPIGYEDQVNLYAYVANDPVNLVDPAGTFKCSGFIECATELRNTVGQKATSGARWLKTKLGMGASVTALSVGIIANETRRSVRIPVFRVFDEENARQNGRSWSLEDPRTMANWRDRLAVYPGWNKGTKVVQGWITMQDMHMKNVLPGPGPNSTAGPQPKDSALGGGPYQGKGNEIIIPNSSKTVKDQVVQPMCLVTQALRSC